MVGIRKPTQEQTLSREERLEKLVSSVYVWPFARARWRLSRYVRLVADIPNLSYVAILEDTQDWKDIRRLLYDFVRDEIMSFQSVGTVPRVCIDAARWAARHDGGGSAGGVLQ